LTFVAFYAIIYTIGKRKGELMEVRRNINTLEFPLWVPTNKLTTYKTDDYALQGVKLPTSKDINILMFILAKAQSLKTREVSFKSLDQILKGMGVSDASFMYNQLRESLDNWQTVFIRYRKKYVYKGNYITTPDISVLSFKNIHKREPVIIHFSQEFYNLMEDAPSLLMSYNIFSNIKRPFAKRLYELLYKIIPDEGEVNISVKNLIKKLPLRYNIKPHKVVLMVSDAINYINNVLETYGSDKRMAFVFSSRKTNSLSVFNFIQNRVGGYRR